MREIADFVRARVAHFSGVSLTEVGLNSGLEGLSSEDITEVILDAEEKFENNERFYGEPVLIGAFLTVGDIISYIASPVEYLASIGELST